MNRRLARPQGAQPQHAHDPSETEDLLIEDEIRAAITDDIPRRRLLELKSLLRSLLFDDKQISQKHLSSKLPGITDIEATTMIKIVNFVKPYIPNRQNYHMFAHQIPFVLMANQVLRSIGRAKQAIKLTPLTRPGNLHSLFVDTTTLYDLFCSSSATKRMEIRDYQGQVIKSASTALDSKDAVFSSFFNIDRLKLVSSSYGLQFGNCIHVLPGLKCTRIYGTSLVSSKSKATKSKITLSASLTEDATKRLLVLKGEKSALENVLKKLRQQLKEFFSNNDIHELKFKWNKDQADSYQDVQVARIKKRELIKGILNAKEKLSRVKQTLYDIRNPSSSHSPSSAKSTIDNSKPCYEKVDFCKLKDQVDLLKQTFCGTDNGIITVTETVAFGVERFKFHLDLYNRFQPLTNDGK